MTKMVSPRADTRIKMQQHSDDIEHNQERTKSELSALMAKCQLGDRLAFARLYQLTAAKLNGVAYRIIGNVDSANEILQEAFIQIWQNKAEYQAHKSEVFTWLSSIVRYRAYDRVRYENRRHQAATIELSEAEQQHLQQVTNSFQITEFPKSALHNCLSKLESNQRQSILMAYLYGHSREEIAAFNQSPVNTVKSWIRRGLARLQLCLSR